MTLVQNHLLPLNGNNYKQCNYIFGVRILVLSFFISVLSVLSFAQTAGEKSAIIETYKGEKYYMHFVAEGETVQSLAKLYGVSNVEILKANPDLALGIKADMVVKIPFREESNAENPIDLPEPQTPGKIQHSDQQSARAGFHTVQPKETWYSLSRLYKIPVVELIEANTAIDTLKIGMEIVIPTPKPDHKVITEGYAEHTVAPQETLYSLSKKYKTSVEELLRLNASLSEGLKAGQIIMVPLEATDAEGVLKVQYTDTSYVVHQVERKETLYSISKLYGIDLNDVLKANPDAAGSLKKGDVLRIPRVSMKVRPFVSPDTVIMRRAINQQAIGVSSVDPCTRKNDINAEYNIALLIPLQLELVDSIQVHDPSMLKTVIDYSSFDFIQFYEGAVMAVDSLAAAGMKIKLHVYDVDYGDNTYKIKKVLAKPELKNMDLLIGPFFAESFKPASDFAKLQGIPIINPLSIRTEMIQGNESVILLQPSLMVQYETLGEFLKNEYSMENVVLVRRNPEENKLLADCISRQFANGNGAKSNLKEVVYSTSGWLGVSKALSTDKSNIVVLATTDRAVLPALLRELAERAESHKISVVGLPEWEELELEYNYLTKLNTHFYAPWFVNYADINAKKFIWEFRKRFAGEPEIDKYAFLGYDATLYFVSALKIYGKHFTQCLEQYQMRGISSKMYFRKTENGGFQNSSAAIYKYSDFVRLQLN